MIRKGWRFLTKSSRPEPWPSMKHTCSLFNEYETSMGASSFILDFLDGKVKAKRLAYLSFTNVD